MIQNLQQLKNLLNPQNNLKATNLIPKDLQVVQETAESRVKDFLFALSSVLALITITLIVLNYSASAEKNRLEAGLDNSLKGIENTVQPKVEIEKRIKLIQEYKSISDGRKIYRNFTNFTQTLFLAIETRNVLTYDFNYANNNINFKIVFNTKDQNFFETLKTKLNEDKLLREIKLNSSNYYKETGFYQTEIEGVYGSR